MYDILPNVNFGCQSSVSLYLLQLVLMVTLKISRPKQTSFVGNKPVNCKWMDKYYMVNVFSPKSHPESAKNCELSHCCVWNIVNIPGWSVVSLSSDMNLSGCMSQFLLPPLWVWGGNYGRNWRQLHDYCHGYNCLVGALLSWVSWLSCNIHDRYFRSLEMTEPTTSSHTSPDADSWPQNIFIN